MTETYTFLAELAQQAGLIIFMLGFAGVVAYALWPSNRSKFKRAADIPLREE
jgi:cytochrome c oxidase cbb3-type subunit 4